jgi:transposase InsO family protein
VDFDRKKKIGLLDGGAEVSCMRARTFERLPKSCVLSELPVPAQFRRLRVADDRLAVPRGYFLLQFFSEELGFRTWPFLVMDELSSEIILGDDFLTAHGAIMDRGTGKTTWPRVKATDLTLKHDEWLAPQSARCVTTIGAGFPADIGLVSSDAMMCVEGVQSVSSKKEVAVVLFNDSEDVLKLRAGQRVAQLQPTSTAELAPLARMLKAQPVPVATPLSSEKLEFLRAKAVIKTKDSLLRQRVLDLLVKHHDAIAANEMDIGKCGVIKHDIRMRSEEPVHIKQFRIPFEHREFLDGQVTGLLEKGVIEPSMSPYNSPVFCVKKPHSNKLRLVQDLRAVNAASYEDKYSFREVADCLDEVGASRSNLFSSLDFLSGYWQQELSDRSRPITAFSVPGRGRFQWTRTVMGLAGSPSSFSRLMEEVFKDISGVITYLDDCLVHAAGAEAHLRSLEECLLRCIRHKLKLNLNKCIFGADTVPYLGFTISEHGVQPGEEKAEAVRNFPPPKNVKQIRQFAGLTNYFASMIKNYALMIGHLTALTTKASKWVGGELPPKAREAFEKLRVALVNRPIMAHPRRNVPFILSTDAAGVTEDCCGGYGAVLSQMQDGVERVVAYASRTLRSHERNYSAYLLEMGAAVWAIEHFHVYLHGAKFTLVTDHRPMESLNVVHKKTLNRLQQMMNEYNFQLLYRPGSCNGPADALSRNPVDALGLRPAKLQELQLAAVDLQQADKVARLRAPMAVRDGVLLRRGVDGRERVAVPPDLRYALFHAAHATRFAGHVGVDKTMDRLSRRYWWPKMHETVASWVAECELCQAAKSPRRFRTREPLRPLPCPTAPNWRVHMDLFGPLKRSAQGNQYILVCTDAFSKLTELVPLPNKEAETVALAFFNRWICRYSCPVTIVSDGGREFVNKLNEDFMRLLEIEHVRTATYHPQTNASAESFNREIIRYLSLMMERADQDWEAWLPCLMFSYNSRVHEATKQSPFFLTYLHEPNLPFFELENVRPLYGEDWPTAALQRMKLAYERTREHLRAAGERNKRYYDRSSLSSREYAIGEDCMVFFPKSSFNTTNHKFVRPWIKHVVVHKESPVTYRVQRLSGTGRTQETVVHVDRMKPYYKPSYTWAAEKDLFHERPWCEIETTPARGAADPGDPPPAPAQVGQNEDGGALQVGDEPIPAPADLVGDVQHQQPAALEQPVLPAAETPVPVVAPAPAPASVAPVPPASVRPKRAAAAPPAPAGGTAARGRAPTTAARGSASRGASSRGSSASSRGRGARQGAPAGQEGGAQSSREPSRAAIRSAAWSATASDVFGQRGGRATAPPSVRPARTRAENPDLVGQAGRLRPPDRPVEYKPYTRRTDKK